MNNCENDILHIVKGDDVYLAVTIIQPDGHEYIMQQDDTLHFVMKQNADSASNVIDSTAAGSTIEIYYENNIGEVICIPHSLTKNIEAGRYVYDVKLVQTENGQTKVTTIIPLSNALVHDTTHVIN